MNDDEVVASDVLYPRGTCLLNFLNFLPDFKDEDIFHFVYCIVCLSKQMNFERRLIRVNIVSYFFMFVHLSRPAPSSILIGDL